MKYGSNYFVDEEVEVFPNFDLSPFFNIGKYRQTTISLTKKKRIKNFIEEIKARISGGANNNSLIYEGPQMF